MNGTESQSVKVVRRWVALYTWGLPEEERERRRLELASDIWEHLHDPEEPDATPAVFGRFLRGIPADVRWRYRTLLESRGARPRSQSMTTSLRTNWWVILTAVLATVPFGLSIAMWAAGAGGPVAFRLVGVVVAAVSGGLMIGGLVRRQTDLVGGSQQVAVGALVASMSGFEFIPLAILVVLGGLWTGNLQLSEQAEGTDVLTVLDRRARLTNRWYVWLAVGAALFAVGWLPLVFDNPMFGGWYTWVLAWFGAIVTGGIGVILAGLRLALRHRTRLA